MKYIYRVSQKRYDSFLTLKWANIEGYNTDPHPCSHVDYYQKQILVIIAKHTLYEPSLQNNNCR